MTELKTKTTIISSLEEGNPFVRKITVRNMLDVIEKVIKSEDNEKIRSKVVEIIKDIDGRDYQKIIETIGEWVRDNIKYIHDPHGIELISDALVTLKNRFGDCDEFSILAFTMLYSIGINCKLVVISTRPDKQFNHVYVKAYNPRSKQWIAIDVTRKTDPVGFEYDKPTRKEEYFFDGKSNVIMGIDDIGKCDYRYFGNTISDLGRRRPSRRQSIIPAMSRSERKAMQRAISEGEPIPAKWQKAAEIMKATTMPIQRAIATTMPTVPGPGRRYITRTELINRAIVPVITNSGFEPHIEELFKKMWISPTFQANVLKLLPQIERTKTINLLTEFMRKNDFRLPQIPNQLDEKLKTKYNQLVHVYSALKNQKPQVMQAQNPKLLQNYNELVREFRQIKNLIDTKDQRLILAQNELTKLVRNELKTLKPKINFNFYLIVKSKDGTVNKKIKFSPREIFQLNKCSKPRFVNCLHRKLIVNGIGLGGLDKPQLNGFFKKVWKGVKSVAKGVVNVVKTAVTAPLKIAVNVVKAVTPNFIKKAINFAENFIKKATAFGGELLKKGLAFVEKIPFAKELLTVAGTALGIPPSVTQSLFSLVSSGRGTGSFNPKDIISNVASNYGVDINQVENAYNKVKMLANGELPSNFNDLTDEQKKQLLEVGKKLAERAEEVDNGQDAKAIAENSQLNEERVRTKNAYEEYKKKTEDLLKPYSYDISRINQINEQIENLEKNYVSTRSTNTVEEITKQKKLKTQIANSLPKEIVEILNELDRLSGEMKFALLPRNEQVKTTIAVTDQILADSFKLFSVEDRRLLDLMSQKAELFKIKNSDYTISGFVSDISVSTGSIITDTATNHLFNNMIKVPFSGLEDIAEIDESFSILTNINSLIAKKAIKNDVVKKIQELLVQKRFIPHIKEYLMLCEDRLIQLKNVNRQRKAFRKAKKKIIDIYKEIQKFKSEKKIYNTLEMYGEIVEGFKIRVAQFVKIKKDIYSMIESLYSIESQMNRLEAIIMETTNNTSYTPYFHKAMVA